MDVHNLAANELSVEVCTAYEAWSPGARHRGRQVRRRGKGGATAAERRCHRRRTVFVRSAEGRVGQPCVAVIVVPWMLVDEGPGMQRLTADQNRGRGLGGRERR